MKFVYRKRVLNSSLSVALLCTLIACGGGSSSDGGTTNSNNVTESDNNNTMDVNENQTQDGNDTTTPDDTQTSSEENTNNNNTDMGSDNNTNPEMPIVTPGGDVSFFGTVDIDQTNNTAFASFSRSNISIPRVDYINSFTVTADSCEITDTSIGIPTNPNINPNVGNPAVVFEPVSAGEVITITSTAGSFAELQRMNVGGFVSYDLPGDGQLPGPVPAGSTVDIPGEIFPTFTNVGLPDVPPIENLSLDTGSALTSNSILTWTGNTSGDSTLYLSATQLPDFSDPTNLDPTNLTIRSVFCTLVDDGNFSFPASIASQLGPGFSDSGFSVSRNGYRFDQRGNALVTVTVTSSN